MKRIQKFHLILIAIILLGAFFRFYKLDWGQGLFTHPDEYHIVISANQLSFPSQMNPHFFNYGTVSIYLLYFTKQLVNLDPFLIGRFFSALFSTLTLPLIYLISLTFLNKKYSLIATLFVALTPGLIQQAHFLTPESNLIFFIFLSLTFLLYFVKQKNISFLILSSISLGISLGIKVSGALFLLPIFLGIILVSHRSLITIISQITLSIFFITFFFFLVDPFVFWDFSNFFSSLRYESNLATGAIPVFYTRQFIDTIPIIFQFEKIYPFALGPALLIFGLTGFFLMLFFILKSIFINHKSIQTTCCLVIVSCFLVFFIPNAFLFTKWTRFVSPTFPFFAIFSAYFLFKISQLKISKFLSLFLVTCTLVLSSFWTLAFFSIYTKDDIRLQASNWIQQNLPSSTIFLEEGNMIDVTLPKDFKRLSLNLYDLDENILTQPRLNRGQQQLINNLEKADYIILQSRRVFKNHQRLPEIFPKTADFYNQLFSGSLGFTEIQELHSYPQINILGWKLEIPDENAEETWSVFDHPVIRIFQKNAK